MREMSGPTKRQRYTYRRWLFFFSVEKLQLECRWLPYKRKFMGPSVVKDVKPAIKWLTIRLVCHSRQLMIERSGRFWSYTSVIFVLDSLIPSRLEYYHRHSRLVFLRFQWNSFIRLALVSLENALPRKQFTLIHPKVFLGHWKYHRNSFKFNDDEFSLPLHKHLFLRLSNRSPAGENLHQKKESHRQVYILTNMYFFNHHKNVRVFHLSIEKLAKINSTFSEC